jgi:preprotein translocase subunit SecF
MSEASTGVSSPSTFAEAFAAAPVSCPGCERARSVAVGSQGEVERLTATLSRVEGRVRMLVDEVEDECVRDSGDHNSIVRSASLSPEQQTTITKVVTDGLTAKIERMTTVGPVIGAELYNKGIWAVGIVCICDS